MLFFVPAFLDVVEALSVDDGEGNEDDIHIVVVVQRPDMVVRLLARSVAYPDISQQLGIFFLGILGELDNLHLIIADKSRKRKILETWKLKKYWRLGTVSNCVATMSSPHLACHVILSNSTENSH